MRTFITIIITIMVTLAITIAVGWFVIARMAGSKVDVAKVRIETPMQGELIETVSATGEVQPKTKVSIRVPLSARIVELPHKEGSRVKEGDLLVRLDPGDLGAFLHRSRPPPTAGKKGTTGDQTKDQFGYVTLNSPIDGVVTQVNATVGETIVPDIMNRRGAVVMEVADLSGMVVVAGVDEWDIGTIRAGQKVAIRIWAYSEKKFEGIVDSVSLTGFETGLRSKTFRVKILLDYSGEQIRSGLTADVEIETRRHRDVLKIPSQAVVARSLDDLPLEIRVENPNVDKKKTLAMVVYRYMNGKAVVTPVAVGPSDGTHTVIQSGLSEDDYVITGPYKVLEKLQHDQEVEKEQPLPTTRPANAMKSKTAAAETAPAK